MKLFNLFLLGTFLGLFSAAFAAPDTACLDEARQWIYSNTSANSSEAAEMALTFCRHGEVSCLQETRDWIYRNTAANSSEAGRRAVEMCGERRRCR